MGCGAILLLAGATFLAFAALPLVLGAPTNSAGARGVQLFLAAGGAPLAVIGLVAFIQGRRAVRAAGLPFPLRWWFVPLWIGPYSLALTGAQLALSGPTWHSVLVMWLAAVAGGILGWAIVWLLWPRPRAQATSE